MNIIEKKAYDFIRNLIIKDITNNSGKLVETDEKIICYVQKNKLRKSPFDMYDIPCHCGKNKYQKKFLKNHNLDKPICYVIDGLNFNENQVNIYEYDNCEVIIKNCNFGFDGFIDITGKCTLDNTNISTFYYFHISADELTIKNMSEDQIKVLDYLGGAKIAFYANDKIDLIDSDISIKCDDINVSFTAHNELNIVNSNIHGKDINCTSDKLNIDANSSLTADNNVNLKSSNFTPMRINAPKVILNGNEITKEQDSIILRKPDDLLEIKRLELVDILKKLKTECKNINSNKISEYQEELSSQPITKVLKK